MEVQNWSQRMSSERTAHRALGRATTNRVRSSTISRAKPGIEKKVMMAGRMHGNKEVKSPSATSRRSARPTLMEASEDEVEGLDVDDRMVAHLEGSIVDMEAVIGAEDAVVKCRCRANQLPHQWRRHKLRRSQPEGRV